MWILLILYTFVWGEFIRSLFVFFPPSATKIPDNTEESFWAWTWPFYNWSGAIKVQIKTIPLIFSCEAKQPVNTLPSRKLLFLIINYLFVMKILNPLCYLSPQWRIVLTCVSKLHVFASFGAWYHVPVNFGVGDRGCQCKALSVGSDIGSITSIAWHLPSESYVFIKFFESLEHIKHNAKFSISCD